MLVFTHTKSAKLFLKILKQKSFGVAQKEYTSMYYQLEENTYIIKTEN